MQLYFSKSVLQWRQCANKTDLKYCRGDSRCVITAVPLTSFVTTSCEKVTKQFYSWAFHFSHRQAGPLFLNPGSGSPATILNCGGSQPGVQDLPRGLKLNLKGSSDNWRDKRESFKQLFQPGILEYFALFQWLFGWTACNSYPHQGQWRGSDANRDDQKHHSRTSFCRFSVALSRRISRRHGGQVRSQQLPQTIKPLRL